MNREQLRPYIRLCKPGIVRMVGVTAAFSYAMGVGDGSFSIWALVAGLIGIMASAAGSAVLNNVIEKDLDARMDRTRNRELPRGEVSPENALGFGLALTLGGTVWLVLTVNLLTAFLVLLTAFLYVLVYTPLKTRTWLNTTIGAIPGAMPTLCGWASTGNPLDFTAWVLFVILFAWQHPHFYAIAWLYREDYEKAGYKMLSVIDHKGVRLILQVILYTALLAAVSVIPAIAGSAGFVYLVGAIVLAAYISRHAWGFVRIQNRQTARALLMASIVYLPSLLAVIVLDIGVRAVL